MMKDLFEALTEAIKAGIARWHFVRYMQSGHSPDEQPF